jgi:hypothetical protein
MIIDFCRKELTSKRLNPDEKELLQAILNDFEEKQAEAEQDDNFPENKISRKKKNLAHGPDGYRLAVKLINKCDMSFSDVGKLFNVSRSSVSTWNCNPAWHEKSNTNKSPLKDSKYINNNSNSNVSHGFGGENAEDSANNPGPSKFSSSNLELKSLKIGVKSGQRSRSNSNILSYDDVNDYGDRSSDVQSYYGDLQLPTAPLTQKETDKPSL